MFSLILSWVGAVLVSDSSLGSSWGIAAWASSVLVSAEVRVCCLCCLGGNRAYIESCLDPGA